MLGQLVHSRLGGEREVEEHRDDRREHDRIGQLELRALGFAARQVTGPPAVADQREDDEAEDDHEHAHADRHVDVEQVPVLAGRVRHRRVSTRSG